MKIIISCLLILIAFFSNAQGGDTSILKLKKDAVYDLHLNGKSGLYLLQIEDSSISTSLVERRFGQPGGQQVNYQQIRELSIAPKGRLWKSLLFCGLGGMVTGALIGRIAYSKPHPNANEIVIDFGPGFSMNVGAAMGTLVGTLTGALVGSSKRKFKISGQKGNYDRMRQMINIQ